MSNLSRRGFVATATSAILPSWMNRALGDTIDPRVAKVVAETMAIDMHNHVYPAGTQQGSRSGNAPPPGGDPGSELSLAEELKLSGLTAICAGFALDRAGNIKPGDARQNFFKWLDAIDAVLEKERVSRALTLKDLRTAHARGQKAIVQTVEGAHFVEGRVERIEEVYKRGLRHLQLLHDRDDMVAPIGDFNGGTNLGGLTPIGVDVIRECNRLRILVDMAHGSSGTLMAALKIAKQPFIVSHSSLDGWTGQNKGMASRSIAKQDAKAVADAGGVVGVWTKGTGSPTEFIKNIKMVVDAIGIDHVGIGTDTDLLSPRPGTGLNRAWKGMTAGFFPVVVEEFLRQGFTSPEIGKIGGGNFGRVFGAVTGQA
jgi:membrane dipeptidase